MTTAAEARAEAYEAAQRFKGVKCLESGQCNDACLAASRVTLVAIEKAQIIAALEAVRECVAGLLDRCECEPDDLHGRDGYRCSLHTKIASLERQLAEVTGA